jgi:hypothetical protein
MHLTTFQSRRNGQAAIELMAALLLLLLIVAGMLHINRMARTSLFLHSVLRGMAGLEAMETTATAISSDYVSGWTEGPDGIRYTADDQSVRDGALPTLLGSLSEHSVQHPADWDVVSSQNQLPVSMVQIHGSPALASLVGFAHEEATLDVPVDTVIRQLVYDKDEVSIKEEVWIPLMGGLY